MITPEPPVSWKDMAAYRREKQLSLSKLEPRRKEVLEYWRSLATAISGSENGLEIVPKWSRGTLHSTDLNVPEHERKSFAPRFVGHIIPRRMMPIHARCRDSCCLPKRKKRIQMRRDAQFACGKAIGRVGSAVRGYDGVDWEWHRDDIGPLEQKDSAAIARRASGVDKSAAPLLEIDLLAMAKPAKSRRRRHPSSTSKVSRGLSTDTPFIVVSPIDYDEEWECIETENMGSHSVPHSCESQIDDWEDWTRCSL